MALDYRRHFLGWERPPLRSVARLLVEEGVEGPRPHPDGVVELSGVTVVLPGARAGRRLRELLVEETGVRGLSLSPPRILTLGGLPELLYLPGRPAPPTLVRLRVWAAALGELPEGELRRLMARPPGAGDLPGWLALARIVDEMHRELGGEGLTFADVREGCGGGLLFDDEPRWRTLARVQEHALTRLEEAGWDDRERARLRALEIPGGPGGILAPGVEHPAELWVAALPQLPGVVREFLAAALQVTAGGPPWLRVLVNAPPSEADTFHPDGALRVEEWEHRAVPLEGGNLRVVGDPGAQAEAVAEAVSGVAEGHAPDEIVAASADPELFPWITRALERRGVPTRLAAGTPLPATPFLRLLRALAEHLREGRADTFAALVRQPELEGWVEGRSLRMLDRYRERFFPYRVDGRPLDGGMDSGRPEPPVVEALRSRLEELLAPFRDRRPLAHWREPLAHLLRTVYGERTLRPDRHSDHLLLEALPLAARALDEFALEAGVREGEEVQGSEALRILADLVAGESVPPRAAEGAVELVGWLELPLDDAPVLVLAGVNEPHLPEAVVGHAFLPDALREVLGIPGNRQRRARDAYLLTASLAVRDEWKLVAGRRGAQGDPVRPSRLLLTGTPEEVARRLVGFLSDELEGGGTHPPGEGAVSTPTAPPLPLPPEPRIRLPEGPVGVPISSFATLLRSPYEWVLANAEGYALGVPDEEARELTPQAFGSLLHGALEVLAGVGREVEDEERIRALLLAELRRRAAAAFGTRLAPAVRIQIAQAELRLMEAARVEAESRREGWFPVAAELSLPKEGVPWEVEGRVFLLKGRVDRVDRHRDGRLRILDYKTGEQAEGPDRAHRRRPRGGGEPVWVDLQLPLYRHLSGELHTSHGELLRTEGAPPPSVGYFTLPRATGGAAIREAEWDAADHASAMGAAEAALRTLAGGEVGWTPEAPEPRADSPLAPLLGVGILSSPPVDDDEEEGS